MSNVKSRGVLGEYQLQNIIEDLLTNEQYEKNVKTKIGSGAVVEFAIKMPHGNNLEKTLWLPIDSKFPKEDYEALVDAYEKGDTDKIEEYRKAFINGIKKNAKDIKEKYIDPPNTTEYGIMFLPYESLFGEVLRVPGLFEQLQKDYKITITGPTTLSALLNSLQMGFRTLAIEKRSSEVWDLLGAVKTEFGQFGTILEKTKKKLDEASNVIDSAGVRTRAIERKLRQVQEMPAAETKLIMDNDTVSDFAEEI
jgi:DNA recombination protein RmuC